MLSALPFLYSSERRRPKATPDHRFHHSSIVAAAWRRRSGHRRRYFDCCCERSKCPFQIRWFVLAHKVDPTWDFEKFDLPNSNNFDRVQLLRTLRYPNEIWQIVDDKCPLSSCQICSEYLQRFRSLDGQNEKPSILFDFFGIWRRISPERLVASGSFQPMSAS